MIPIGRLDEIIEARVFKGTRKAIAKRIKKHPGRWDSESHYIRSAIINFERLLDKEELMRKYDLQALRRSR